MNQIWNFGRFVLLMLVLVSISFSVGCERSLSTLRTMIGIVSGTSFRIVMAAKRNEQGPQTDETASTDESKTSAEELAKDWEKPTFAILFSGRQHGYMEPCGCTGLANQKGGLMRRHSALKVLEDRGWDVLKIDSGNQVDRFGQQPTLKLEKTLEAICEVMDYDVVGIGADDLKLSGDLAQAIASSDPDFERFVCANVEIVDPSICVPFRVMESGGQRIGVTMVLGDEYLEELAKIDDVTVRPAEDALTAIAPQLKAQNCDLKILIATASLDECRDIAKKFPVFDILITAGGGGDPTLHPELINVGNGRSTSMVQVGVKGMYIGIIGYYENEGAPTIKYERVPLDERFEDSPEIRAVFTRYQNELKHLWQAGELADIKPQPHPSGHTFVGSDACADCHDDEFQIWLNGNSGDGGPHEHATASLTDPNERSWIQRNFDPECVSCHMTGWNPQGYYPYESGYLDIEKDTHLFNNGCENCHGPGSAHITAERNDKDNAALLAQLRKEMRLTVAEARESACVQCHDLDNSPDYVKEGGFDEYWPEIEH